MYAIALHIRPTSHLTFRILPGSILDIATYPFVPPHDPFRMAQAALGAKGEGRGARA